VNIGVLGGTFDPIHIGHLIIAEQVRVKLKLSKVLFVPAGQPWLKVNHGIAPQNHRVEMVRSAIAANPFFELCTLEVERPGTSYTVDTIMALREQLGAQTSLFFILGYDSLSELALWKEPSKLVQICQLVAVPRLGSNLPDLKSLETRIPGVTNSVVQLELPIIEISSSQIRAYLAQGLSIRYLIPDGVEKYIAEQKLYSER
jgi:nicotinate-nucleotide adenylyltransferase